MVGLPFSVCNVGDVRQLDVTVTQTDGQVTADVNDRPALYSGGLDADGAFELGAYAQQAGALDITARKSGTLACNNLGLVVSGGRAGAPDLGAGAALFRQACEGGIGQGCFNLAQQAEAGAGVPRDPALARSLRSTACARGVARACSR